MNEKEKHVIKLAGGTELSCTLNGNNWILDAPVSDEVLTSESIKGMTIDGVPQTYDKVTNHFMEDGKDHVIFGYMTQNDILKQRIADLEAMMVEGV